MAGTKTKIIPNFKWINVILIISVRFANLIAITLAIYLRGLYNLTHKSTILSHSSLPLNINFIDRFPFGLVTIETTNGILNNPLCIQLDISRYLSSRLSDL